MRRTGARAPWPMLDRYGGRRAFVVYWDDEALRPVGKYDWLPKDRLIPVPVDPNWVGG